MQTAALVLTAAPLTVIAAGTTFVVDMRRKSPVVLKAVRRTSRAAKPLVLRKAGGAGSPTAVVEHIGRHSGRRYQNPVVAAATADGFVIALPYGPDTDWLKNVLAAGGATIRVTGETHTVDSPNVVDLREVNAAFAERERRMQNQFRVRDALTVRNAGTDLTTRAVDSTMVF